MVSRGTMTYGNNHQYPQKVTHLELSTSQTFLKEKVSWCKAQVLLLFCNISPYDLYSPYQRFQILIVSVGFIRWHETNDLVYKKWSFRLRISSLRVDLVIFTEVLNGKLHFFVQCLGKWVDWNKTTSSVICLHTFTNICLHYLFAYLFTSH